ncbi:non-ribosomal peptide synthetase [Nocardiopsis potens]|uniref:non-ribosomal peptide synthetase n=1 Tax=Nocardiopsis potens TaxID=1246458 RepID=UPI0003464EAD|nr:non-ribosomal peptide synthetase [Nocardiopsis potens]
MHSGSTPLSYAQRGLWFSERLSGAGGAYNVPVRIRLTGRPNPQALEQALRDVVKRHEPLRTVFPETGTGPVQRVLSVVDVPALLHLADGAEPAEAQLARFARHRFDLAAEPPIRALLADSGEEGGTLLVVVHHIAIDGWSCGVLLRELNAAYSARLGGAAPSWTELPVRYSDYVLWQRKLLGDPSDPGSPLAAQTAYWERRLAELPEEIALPYDRPRPAEATQRGGAVPVVLGRDLHTRLSGLARRERCTLFTVLLAALSATLTRFGAGPDVPIGAPTAGRSEPELHDNIGLFVNTLVLRVDTSGDPAFTDLLARARRTAADAFANGEAPFELLVERLQPVRTLSRHPLFQTMLTLNRAPVPEGAEGGSAALGADTAGVDNGTVKFDLDLGLTERYDGAGPAGLSGALGYACDLFDADTAERIADALVRVLRQAAEDPARRIGAFEVLSPEERTGLEAAFRGPDRPVRACTVTDLFERAADAAPGTVALRCGDREWTYARLDAETGRLAHALQARGAGPGSLVGVCADRSAEMVIALLAVLRSGAGYIPVDPAYPAERKRSMMAQASAGTLVAAPGTDASWHGGETVGTDAPAPPGARGRPNAGTAPGDLAYVIYTSGSSGRPKPVMVEHRTLVNYLEWCREEYAAGGTGGAPVFSSYSFDMLVPDIYVPLITGQAVTVVPEGTDPSRLGAALMRHAPYAFIKLTPGHLDLLAEQLTEEEAGRLCSLLAVGADTFQPRVLDAWRSLDPRTPVVNEYGPTEASVGNCVHRVEGPVPPSGVPIGSPIANTAMYILDGNLNPVPRGSTGELYIGGDCVVAGYGGLPALTASKFLPDPFAGGGSRMYRTGDLGRMLPGGAMEFLGRRDEQLKVNGFRIEPGEVEAALEEDPSVAKAVVTARSAGGGAPTGLVAHLLPEEGAALDTGLVRDRLARRVPAYMLPAAFAVVDDIPLTSNGKLDRAALARSAAEPGPRPARAPGTDTERELHRHFCDVLGLPEADTAASFFDLGGNSLRAAVLVTRLRSALGADLALPDLFRTPSVEALARALAGRGGGRPPGAAAAGFAPLLTLRGPGGEGGESTPLFCVAPATGLAWAYAGLLRHLPGDLVVHGLQSPGLTDPDHAPADIGAFAADLVARVRRVRPTGPYRLLGWSLGGTVAHEMAVRLQEEGEEVDRVVVLDSNPGVAVRKASGFSPRSPAVIRGALENFGVPAAEQDAAALTAEGVARALRAHSPTWGAITAAQAERILQSYARSMGLGGPRVSRVYRGDLLLVFTEHSRNAAAWAGEVRGEIIARHMPVSHHDLLGPVALERVGPLATRYLLGGPDAPGPRRAD